MVRDSEEFQSIMGTLNEHEEALREAEEWIKRLFDEKLLRDGWFLGEAIRDHIGPSTRGKWEDIQLEQNIDHLVSTLADILRRNMDGDFVSATPENLISRRCVQQALESESSSRDLVRYLEELYFILSEIRIVLVETGYVNRNAHYQTFMKCADLSGDEISKYLLDAMDHGSVEILFAMKSSEEQSFWSLIEDVWGDFLADAWRDEDLYQVYSRSHNQRLLEPKRLVEEFSVWLEDNQYLPHEKAEDEDWF